MFKLKQKTKTAGLSLALAAAMTGGVMMGTSTSVQAINIAQDGIGEVLIFPYYTVRNGFSTYFNVTNTSEKTIAVRVRWHEGVNSRDVRDFNVIMSPSDVWTAAVVPGVDDEGNEFAKIVTNDTTCTAPLLNDKDGGRPGWKGKKFTNLAYSGKNADGGDASLDRTKEGYFTVISMGVAIEGSVTAQDALHIGGDNQNEGQPQGCADIVARSSARRIQELRADFGEPQNLIKGRAIVIDTKHGIGMGYDPVVLANFHNPAVIDGVLTTAGNIIFPPESDQPNLSFASPAEASWIDDTPGIGPVLATVTASQAAASYGIGIVGKERAIDAVSVLFNRAAIVNDYNVATESATDWVVTLPTKRYYVDDFQNEFSGLGGSDITGPIPPFDLDVSGEVFNANASGKSCFDVTMRIWDREEGEVKDADLLGFSPREPGALSDKFCYETNVISFGKAIDVDANGKILSSNLLGSKLVKSFSTLAADNGWAQLEFGDQGGESLPVIGMRFEVRKKLDNPETSYGFSHVHSYKRDTEAYKY